MVEYFSSCCRDDDHLARRLRQPAEPVADRVVRPRQRRPRHRLDLLPGREVQVLVLAEGLQRGVQVLRAEQASTELDELGVDAPDLLEADGVHVLGRDVERGAPSIQSMIDFS